MRVLCRGCVCDHLLLSSRLVELWWVIEPWTSCGILIAHKFWIYLVKLLCGLHMFAKWTGDMCVASAILILLMMLGLNLTEKVLQFWYFPNAIKISGLLLIMFCSLILDWCCRLTVFMGLLFQLAFPDVICSAAYQVTLWTNLIRFVFRIAREQIQKKYFSFKKRKEKRLNTWGVELLHYFSFFYFLLLLASYVNFF